MANIIHRIGIKAPTTKVYEALASIEGLTGWWTQETSGSAKVGDKIEFRFRNDDGSIKGFMKMEVSKLEPARSVLWRCLEGPPDWIGTELSFRLSQEGEYTILIFGHNHWKEATESTAHCSMKWAVFLMSLRDLVEKGRGQPAPHDIKIDNWN